MTRAAIALIVLMLAMVVPTVSHGQEAVARPLWSNGAPGALGTAAEDQPSISSRAPGAPPGANAGTAARRLAVSGGRPALRPPIAALASTALREHR